MKRTLIYFLLLVVLSACGDQKIDTALAKAEMEAREIKKVSEAEIVEEAMRRGREVSKDFQIKETSDGNTSFRSLVFETLEGVEITHYYLAEGNELMGKALGIFEAYQYNSENNISSEDIVQKLEDGNTFLYTKPSYLNDQMVGVWALKFQRKDLVLNIGK